MNNVEIPIIERTFNYDKFNGLLGNRDLKKRALKRVGNEFESVGHFDPAFPIVVDEQFNVLDGQHRLHVAKEKGWPVFFVVSKSVARSMVPGLNSSSTPWGIEDYLEWFASQGLADYVEAKSFLAESKWCTISSLLYNSGYRSQDFKLGLFTMKRRDDFTNIDQILDWLDFMGVEKSCLRHQSFHTALGHMVRDQNYNQERFFAAARPYIQRFVKMVDLRSYREFLRKTYNVKLPKNKRLAPVPTRVR